MIIKMHITHTQDTLTYPVSVQTVIIFPEKFSGVDVAGFLQ